MLEGATLLYFDGRLTEVAVKVAAVAAGMGVPMLVEGERERDGQGLTLVHLPAQLEPFLTQNTTQTPSTTP